MNLIAWVPNSWKAAVWRIGAWVSSAGGLLPRRVHTVGADLRTSSVSPAARNLSVSIEQRTAIVAAALRALLVPQEQRAFTMFDPRTDTSRPDPRVALVLADAARVWNIAQESRTMSLTTGASRTQTIPEEQRTFAPIS